MIMDRFNRIVKQYRKDYKNYEFDIETWSDTGNIILTAHNIYGDDIVSITFGYFMEVQAGELEFVLEYMNNYKPAGLSEKDIEVASNLVSEFEHDQA